MINRFNCIVYAITSKERISKNKYRYIKLNKQQKNIGTWIVIWAGLLIAVLYSPVGSPGLYSSQNYFAANQSAAMKQGAIQNAPVRHSSQENNESDPDMPDISPVSKTKFSSGNYNQPATSSAGSYSGMQNSTYQSDNSVRNESGGSGNAIIAGRSSRNSEGTSGMTMTNGLTAMSLTSELNPANRQSATAITPAGGPDPGGDPTGPPIPVGDGWGILVLFACIYVLVKRKLFF